MLIKIFFLHNSIVYSPTTVHLTNVYDCSDLIKHRLTILLFGMIQVYVFDLVKN
jgi:hypothetical protein